jgi:hypothetical protein
LSRRIIRRDARASLTTLHNPRVFSIARPGAMVLGFPTETDDATYR